jgi:hypothetical protein
MQSLAAEVNQTGVQTLSVPDAFETDDSFAVELRNHGEATHVHLHLDDELSTVASIATGNHYVEADSTHTVRVSVNDSIPDTVHGKLKLVTGYGSETHFVDLTITPTQKPPVDIDPQLSKPNTGEAPALSTVRLPVSSSQLVTVLPTVALSTIAVIFALAAVLTGSGTDPVLAVLAVVAAIAAAAYVALH